MQNIQIPDNLTLGKEVSYKDTYSPDLLQPVSRQIGRNSLNLGTELPFSGIDIWNGYEVSWLNPKGKPQVAILRCSVPVYSPNLIESKSFKLYLNSLNQSPFASFEVVANALQSDLSACAGEAVDVQLYPLNHFSEQQIGRLEGQCIDDMDITVDHYSPDVSLLKSGDIYVEETINSHLLKSNCLITNQPDWASVQIRYSGTKIEHASLLQYLVSFRQHNEFHEQCVERIFCDILSRCNPEKLTVYARYTRRGGLDINPFRSNFEQPYKDSRLARQ